MTPFHRWLVRQRKFCEHPGCIMKLEAATKVVNRNGKDFVYCDFHSYTPKPQDDWEYKPKQRKLEAR